MKIFISYSRDDSAFVYALAQELRKNPRYQVWIDLQIPGSEDWWNSILDAIEWCDCCLFVLTPHSVESIYCEAEIGYVLAWNKPILPLLHKQCDYPPSLDERRIQRVDVTAKFDIREIYVDVASTLVEVLQGIRDGDYSRPAQPPARPPVPPTSPLATDPEDPFDLFNLAEDKAEQGDMNEAERLFKKLKAVDPEGFGPKADARLTQLHRQREMITAYLRIARNIAEGKLDRAKIAWEVYQQKYGAGYDPNGYHQQFASDSPGSPTDRLRAIKRAASLEIMPPPFAWIDIPAGKVTLVTRKGWPTNYIPKGGSKEFSVPAFAIGKYPVTNAQFEKFVDAKGYEEKKWWTDEGWQVRGRQNWTKPRYWQASEWNVADYPVVGVSWYEAVAFCLWLSDMTGEQIMLPTEQQWQRAAQGDTSRAYPWGEKFDRSRCSFNSGGITSVTQYEGKDKGDSPFGVVDMSGNVWEWCVTDYDTGEQDIRKAAKVRVLRGGSWGGNVFFLRADFRNGLAPDGIVIGGFRLAHS